jgi:hypothetical protein
MRKITRRTMLGQLGAALERARSGSASGTATDFDVISATIWGTAIWGVMARRESNAASRCNGEGGNAFH